MSNYLFTCFRYLARLQAKLEDDGPRFGFYETFTYANGHHGLIQKSYERGKIAEAFDLSFFNGQGYGYMLSQDGDILRRSDCVIDDNVAGGPKLTEKSCLFIADRL